MGDKDANNPLEPCHTCQWSASPPNQQYRIPIPLEAVLLWSSGQKESIIMMYVVSSYGPGCYHDAYHSICITFNCAAFDCSKFDIRECIPTSLVKLSCDVLSPSFHQVRPSIRSVHQVASDHVIESCFRLV